MIQPGSMLDIVLRYIPISSTEKFKKISPRYDWDPPPWSMIVEKVDGDFFNIQKNNYKEKRFEEKKSEGREWEA